MTPGALDGMVTPADAEALAAGVLPAGVERFVTGGAGSEITLAANRAAFDRLHLVPRVLADVSATSTTATLLADPAALPLAVAPMAYQRAVHPDGELAAARAAFTAGVPFTACTFSSTPVEDIAATGATVWFQLYWLRDRGLTKELLARAEAAGARALMLTVDTPYMGRRQADMRGAFTLPEGVSAVHFERGRDGVPRGARDGVSAIAAQTAGVVDPSLSWSDLDWLRDHTRLPLVLKGVLDPADADRAAAHGVDGIVVSNHGGRQLDGALPALDALPAVVDAVAGRSRILLDSGVRTGTDILKALALGASGVLVGRPVLWGLAAGGEAGVTRVLTLLREELENALALAGCPDPASAARLRTFRAQGGDLR
ncbi:Putative hydroxymandelate oxidase [Streptomyces venezuelae]|uniref:alpha-hydroxy acid oxidase n=1 Tax=Streptomyces gardneri TaxID=66892 RepID=UPI0006BDB9CB|nr:alpha-hydroxy acid oxidase [Streptomyces gardneri]ALO13231.1 Putative hydroxymandelate oxidase [Streptomyces venezuelae]WRK41460.1 alpha-hydroxy acid oxidase [Streptomyces venezuelae]CUM36083.1 (S)-2-hydroxy-acid oxidase [Streptomyces venezuelae]